MINRNSVTSPLLVFFTIEPICISSFALSLTCCKLSNVTLPMSRTSQPKYCVQKLASSVITYLSSLSFITVLWLVFVDFKDLLISHSLNLGICYLLFCACVRPKCHIPQLHSDDHWACESSVWGFAKATSIQLLFSRLIMY